MRSSKGTLANLENCNMRTLARFLTTLFVAAGLLVASAARAETSAAIAPVEALHGALLDAMKRAGELGYKGRYDALAPVITRTFDFENISRLVLGKNWTKIDAAQQKLFVETFSKLSVATYASRFDSFSGESFQTTGEAKQSGNNMLVKTELVRTNDTPVSLNYLVSPGTDGAYRILNVVADGISDLSLKRSEYSSIFNSGGFETLISKLNAKIEQYESPTSNNT
jgi:phospholipid transport system substrate-binding protein